MIEGPLPIRMMAHRSVAVLLNLLLVIGGAVGGLLILALSGATATWLGLLCLALVTGTAILWSRNIKSFLLCGLVFTLPLTITKSIVASGGVYAPGLELSLSDIFLFGLLAERVCARHVLHWPGLRTPLGWSVILAYFAWVWASALWGQHPPDGLVSAISVSRFLLVFLLVFDAVDSGKEVHRVLTAATAGLVLQLVMAGAQFVTRTPLALQGAKVATLGVRLVYADAGGVEAFRPSGFLLHPNVFADYLVMLLPVPLLLMLQGRRRVGRPVWWVSTGLVTSGLAALTASLSRGGWISLTVAVAFLLAVGVTRGLVRRHHVVAAIVLALAGGGGVLVAYPAARYRLTRSDNRSTESRLLMMEQAWLIIRGNPILGVGLGRYSRSARENVPASFGRLRPEYQRTLTRGVVHNAYLLTWAESGVVALVLLLGVYGTFVRAFFRVRLWRDPIHHAVALGIVAGLIGQLVFYLFDHFYLNLHPGTLWAMLGLLGAMVTFQPDAGSIPGAAVARRVGLAPC